MASYRRSGGFTDRLLNAPWQTFAIVIALGFILLWQVGILGWLKNLFATSPSAAKQAAINTFTAANSGTSIPAATILKDAQALALAWKTNKDASWWDVVNRPVLIFWDTDQFNIIKKYANPVDKAALSRAYSDVYTDGRDIDTDLNSFMTATSITYLRTNGIM